MRRSLAANCGFTPLVLPSLNNRRGPYVENAGSSLTVSHWVTVVNMATKMYALR
jgi:hypothetical protein